MSDSILNSTKKNLGIGEDYTVFDPDITMHINSVFLTLNQLGVGPVDGFMIEDADATWVSFLGSDKRWNAVKTYVWLRVRLLFDPPATSYVIEAFQKEIAELEWRLNVHRENTMLTVVDPNEPSDPTDPVDPIDSSVVEELADDEHPEGIVNGQSFEILYENAKV